MERAQGAIRELIMGRSYPWILLAFLLLLGGCNPFAPDIDESGDQQMLLLSDQGTMEGVFNNLRYSYTFKDTTIYGGLLTQDFTFTYRDYDKLVDVSWGRDEEMRITSRLFQNAGSLNLVWNNIVGLGGDSLLTSVTRSFNLSITFSANDIVRVDGRVNLLLKRESTSQPWRIIQWRDESNY